MISYLIESWKIFVSSWFNIPLALTIIAFTISIFIYAKINNIKTFRILNNFLITILIVSSIIGYYQGYRFCWDIQDKLYILCILVYFITTFINKILKNHIIVEKVLIVFLLSSIAFITISTINLSNYLLFISLLLIILHISYSFSKNINLFLFGNICLILNHILFLIKDGNIKKLLTLNILSFLYLISFVYFITTFCFLFFLYKKNDWHVEEETKELFPERKYDLERIKEYLQKYNLIGINSIWGNGKSFLFEKLSEECSNDYFFLCINVLSMRVEKVESLVLDQLNHILEENRIFSNASGKIKCIFKESFFHNLGEIFFGTESYYEQIVELQKDVAKLGKPVIITFEDIDRINDPELLYKIFALADSLKCTNIRILFQYEEKKLLSILNVDKIYLEKYIQHTVNLTNISFDRMIKYLLPPKDEKNLSQEDFNFLLFHISLPLKLQKLLGINKEFELDLFGFQIRKYELFIDDIQNAITYPSFTNIPNFKRKIIIFYLIKHFDYDLYDRLNDTDSFIQNCTFSYQDKEYTIIDILRSLNNNTLKSEDLEKLLNISINCNHFIYLILLEYDFEQMYKDLQKESETPTKSDYTKRMADILNESITIIKARQINDKIDRLFMNLFGAGKSENTDFENAVKEMNTKVLNQPTIDLQEEGYKQLSEIMYYGNFEKAGNNSIFRFGISNEFSLFQAYSIYESNVGQWIKLIDFFIKPNKEISSELIQILNYCKLDDRDILLHIFKLFSSLKVIGNLNSSISYKKFLYNYFSAIMNNGYMRIDKLHWLVNDNSKTFEKDMYLNNIIPECLEEIQNVSKYTTNTEILNEFSIIEKFIIKNKEIIQADKELNEFIPKIKTTSTITDQIVEQSKKYKEMNLTKSELQDLLDKQYLNHEINFYEYKCFMNNVFGQN